jgi:hypothetical protein
LNFGTDRFFFLEYSVFGNLFFGTATFDFVSHSFIGGTGHISANRTENMLTITIKENSRLAGYAARMFKSEQMAVVLGKTIRLYNVDRDEFLKKENWVRHEVAHVKQFQQKGFVYFIISYCFNSFYSGYEYNRYEEEARAREQDMTILRDVEFV